MRSVSQRSGLLEIHGRRAGPRLVLTAVGEVDIRSVGDLRRALANARDGGASEIWLDLTRTTFIDCSGLHALLDLRAGLRDRDQRLGARLPERTSASAAGPDRNPPRVRDPRHRAAATRRWRY
jgi:anti-anti-sigma factor